MVYSSAGQVAVIMIAGSNPGVSRMASVWARALTPSTSRDKIQDFYVLKDLHREALEAVSESPERPSPLVFEKTKPIPLRLFTPKIVEV